MEQQNQLRAGLQGLAEKIKLAQGGIPKEGKEQQQGPEVFIQFCKSNGFEGPCDPACIEAGLKAGGQIAELAKQAQEQCQ